MEYTWGSVPRLWVRLTARTCVCACVCACVSVRVSWYLGPGLHCDVTTHKELCAKSLHCRRRSSFKVEVALLVGTHSPTRPI